MRRAPAEQGAERAHPLTPYVPRLLIEWLRQDPSARYRPIEGTLAFVDISGFTQMTERLARKGKVGAEEMSDTLNACFSDLLSVAYDCGAGLVKWGGDAVLLLFEDEGHAPRACKAALQMQQEIRRIGRLKTTAGPVTLRMSIGIHSGSFDFFLVGDLHRELLITGPDASVTVSMEQIADAGEVAVSPATAALLDPTVLGARKDDAILLQTEPDVESERARPVGAVDPSDLAQCLPVAIRKHLLLEEGEPEHRAVAVAFVEFSGVQDILREEGPDALADALEECITAVQYATDRYDVTFFETDINKDGGKIMLVCGAPTTAGDDQERLLRVVRDVIDAKVRIPLRVGVNCGRVFSGDFGPPFRRTYSIKGDAVNLAARVMGKAQPGQILVTPEVLSGSRARFETSSLEPFHVKGKAQPVQAVALGPLVASQTADESSAALVGRDRELTALLLSLQSAHDWQGRLVVVVGEPGIGKSRLIEELRARAEVPLVLGASCEQYDSTTPYFAFKRLLRLVLGIDKANGGKESARLLAERVEEVAPHLLPWLPLIAVPLDLDVPETPETMALGDNFRRRKLEEIVRDLLGITLATPTLLVFEDVHWMDDASSDLLRALTESISLRPWLVVVTRREETSGFHGSPDERTVILELGPLDSEAADALAEAATEDTPLPPHQLEALTERAGGNPLFLQQLVARAREADGDVALPESVEGLLAARIDRLPPRDRTVLRYASVLGMRFERDVLTAALEDDAKPDDDVWLRLAELITEEAPGELRFHHALLRDAAYEGLPYKRRQRLHERVGETIERLSPNPQDDAGRLSLHFFHGQNFHRAWTYSRAAADSARDIHAYNEAAVFYRRALDSARRLDSIAPADVAATSEAMGDALCYLGEFTRATNAYRSTRALVEVEPAEQARLMLKEESIPWRQGQYARALRWVRRALRVLDGVDGLEASRVRARLFSQHAAIRLRQGRPLEVIDWCRKAIDEATRCDADAALAHAYYLLDYAYFSIGRYDDVVFSRRALDIYERTGDLVELGGVYNNLGMFAYFEGRWDDAIEHYLRAEEAWQKAGDRWAASFATVNRGEILSDQGRLDEAEPLFNAGLRLARALDATSRVADVALQQGRLRARAGKYEEAHELFDESLDIYERAGARGDVLTVQARIAECLLVEGRLDESSELSTRTLEQAGQVQGLFLLVPSLERVRAIARMQLGDLEGAREALRVSLTEGRAKGADYEVALALQVLVTLRFELGEPTDAVEAERIEMFDRLGIVSTPAVAPALAPRSL
jgi:class 3 adenylate cyclase/tetratricopeptide (TPR) repeat protein